MCIANTCTDPQQAIVPIQRYPTQSIGRVRQEYIWFQDPGFVVSSQSRAALVGQDVAFCTTQFARWYVRTLQAEPVGPSRGGEVCCRPGIAPQDGHPKSRESIVKHDSYDKTLECQQLAILVAQRRASINYEQLEMRP